MTRQGNFRMSTHCARSGFYLSQDRLVAPQPRPSGNNRNDVSPGASQDSDTDEPTTTETDASPLTWIERDVAYTPPPGVSVPLQRWIYQVEDDMARPWSCSRRKRSEEIKTVFLPTRPTHRVVAAEGLPLHVSISDLRPDSDNPRPFVPGTRPVILPML